MIHLNNENRHDSSSNELDDSLELHMNIVNMERNKRKFTRSTFQILSSQRELFKTDTETIDTSVKIGIVNNEIFHSILILIIYSLFIV